MKPVRFHTDHLLLTRPRPREYLGEMRVCATEVKDHWWHFDRDAPCYKRLENKYRDYVPTADDFARFELAKAEWKARRDEHTRRLWATLHRYTLTPEANDPMKLATFLGRFAASVPCGECLRHWHEILKELPPDAADPFAWGCAAHNAVNRLLNKPQWTVERARAAWSRG